MLDIAVVERLAFEAMQWAKMPENNPGADQPSLVFARQFAFILARYLRLNPTGAEPRPFCED